MRDALLAKLGVFTNTYLSSRDKGKNERDKARFKVLLLSLSLCVSLSLSLSLSLACLSVCSSYPLSKCSVCLYSRALAQSLFQRVYGC